MNAIKYCLAICLIYEWNIIVRSSLRIYHIYNIYNSDLDTLFNTLRGKCEE